MNKKKLYKNIWMNNKNKFNNNNNYNLIIKMK